MDFDEAKKTFLKYAKDKRIQWALTAVLFVAVLAIGINIRIQPIVGGSLIDPTTNDYIPLALDPFYFLRVSQTLVENGGELPAVDNMRYQALNATWTTEILPASTVFLWRIIKVFDNSATLNFANVLNPVVFFGLGMIVFFALALVLTKSKTIAVSSSLILTVIPPYLYRTLGGFSDHESIGMFGFFLALIAFAFGMFYLEKKNASRIGALIIGLIAGIATTFSIVSWGGMAVFLFMILPLAFFARWLTKREKNELNYILFYLLWIIGVLIGGFIFGMPLFSILRRYMISTTGILTFFTLGYMFFEYLIVKIKNIPKTIKDKKEIFSIIGFFVFGGILYQIFVGNFLSMVGDLILRVLYPFGTDRVSLTVAENKQPYLNDLIAQVGKTMFYTFLFGCGIVGAKIASGIKNKKYSIIFGLSFSFFIFGILFSRISEASILNGSNFISRALFFVSFLSLLISTIYAYKNSKWTVDTKWIFIAAWMIPMLLAARSAIRVFFSIVPFISLMIPIVVFELFKFGKSKKDEITKLLSYALAIGITILVIVSSFQFYSMVDSQARMQTPSYNQDWQNAMSWVRDNTPKGSIFLHWWDYGYWVQTGGKRPSVTDGGHFNGYWDHLIGRYVLTTPYPETAKSFMKAHDVSYLLIDPTDVGKYSAYSSIGDGNDSSDRASYFPTLISAPSEIRETNNGTIRFYQGGAVLDEDLTYNQNGREIFLPRGRAGVGAIILEKQNYMEGNDTRVFYKQPEAIYVYNGQQHQFPMRYLFISGQLIDYNSGVNAVAYVYSNVVNQQFDPEGAIMYLSEKTKDSLVAQLYLMNDPDNLYPELELVHAQSAYPFGFNYGGYRGPISIYEVKLDEMQDIIAREEFTYASGGYGEFDDLQFVR